jgi:hypothetical protein
VKITDNNAYPFVIFRQMNNERLFAVQLIPNSLKAIYYYDEQLLYFDVHHQNYETKIFCMSIPIN